MSDLLCILAPDSFVRNKLNLKLIAKTEKKSGFMDIINKVLRGEKFEQSPKGPVPTHQTTSAQEVQGQVPAQNPTSVSPLSPPSADLINIGGVEFKSLPWKEFAKYVYDNLPSDLEGIKQKLSPFIADEKARGYFAKMIKRLKDWSPVYFETNTDMETQWRNILMQLAKHVSIEEIEKSGGNWNTWSNLIKEYDKMHRRVIYAPNGAAFVIYEPYLYFPHNHPFVQQYINRTQGATESEPNDSGYNVQLVKTVNPDEVSQQHGKPTEPPASSEPKQTPPVQKPVQAIQPTDIREIVQVPVQGAANPFEFLILNRTEAAKAIFDKIFDKSPEETEELFKRLFPNNEEGRKNVLNLIKKVKEAYPGRSFDQLGKNIQDDLLGRNIDFLLKDELAQRFADQPGIPRKVFEKIKEIGKERYVWQQLTAVPLHDPNLQEIFGEQKQKAGPVKQEPINIGAVQEPVQAATQSPAVAPPTSAPPTTPPGSVPPATSSKPSTAPPQTGSDTASSAPTAPSAKSSVTPSSTLTRALTPRQIANVTYIPRDNTTENEYLKHNRHIELAVPVIFKNRYNEEQAKGDKAAQDFIAKAAGALEVKRVFQISFDLPFLPVTQQTITPRWNNDIQAFEYGMKPDVDKKIEQFLGHKPKSKVAIFKIKYDLVRDQSGVAILQNVRFDGNVTLGFNEGYLPVDNNEAAKRIAEYAESNDGLLLRYDEESTRKAIDRSLTILEKEKGVRILNRNEVMETLLKQKKSMCRNTQRAFIAKGRGMGRH